MTRSRKSIPILWWRHSHQAILIRRKTRISFIKNIFFEAYWENKSNQSETANKVHTVLTGCIQKMPKYLLVFAIFAAILTVIRSETGFRLDEYHDYDAMLQIMKDVNERCPEKTRLYKLPPVGIEEFDTSVYPLNVSGLTVEGRELWVLEFAKNPGKHTPGKKWRH